MTVWQMWAQRDPAPVDGREFAHFGDRQWVVGCYGGDVVPVRLVEDPDGTYWGWIYSEDSNQAWRGGVPQMVQPHRGMFTMQFPYGPEAEEKRGNGRTVRLYVEILPLDADGVAFLLREWGAATQPDVGELPTYDEMVARIEQARRAEL